MIINLTQHAASAEQLNAGVIEPLRKDLIKKELNFDDLPTEEEILERADRLANLAENEGEHVTAALIGGAPYLMAPLERALRQRNITPLYAFSRRESVERTLKNGKVEKTTIFRHLGFIEAVKNN